MLMDAKLQDVRCFGDLFREFVSEARRPLSPHRKLRLTVLCNRPSKEFVAFQVGGGQGGGFERGGLGPAGAVLC